MPIRSYQTSILFCDLSEAASCGHFRAGCDPFDFAALTYLYCNFYANSVKKIKNVKFGDFISDEAVIIDKNGIFVGNFASKRDSCFVRAVNGADLFADSEKFCQKYTYRIVLIRFGVSKGYASIYLSGTIVRILNRQFPFPLLRDTAYAAVEPCRRQRPERSEDAAREQAAEGRTAKRFRPDKKQRAEGAQ